MEFRDLKKQYTYIKADINQRMQDVIEKANFIQGNQVTELENTLADYVGVKHCISCANGTDALQLALMALEVGSGDAVFVPDFTFFSSGEVAASVGAAPVFVDVDKDTCNIDATSLERMIEKVIKEGKLKPKVILTVDLFGQPADYPRIIEIAQKYNLQILEDAAQGFGGAINHEKACAFGDIATTSFFPVKPLGCYGDGGAIFTNNDAWADLLRSYKVHGKGASKYDNIRIGMNSRLDTLQAAVLQAKFPVFVEKELGLMQVLAEKYANGLKDIVKTPVIMEGFYSSWAQYTIQLENANQRDGLQAYLKEQGIPSMIYYPKPMHRQEAFAEYEYEEQDYPMTNELQHTVLSLPFHPYLERDEVNFVVTAIRKYLKG